MKKVNVLFLDIDGVLNSPKWQKLLYHESELKGRSTRSQEFDPVNIRIVNQLCHRYDIHLVISSTWRSLENIETVLQVGGISGKFFDLQDLTRDPSEKSYRPIPMLENETFCDFRERMGTITTTTLSGVGGHRGKQIEDWFSKFGMYVDKWAILDDESDMLENQLSNFVQTDFYNGITLENFERLMEIYSGDANGT